MTLFWDGAIRTDYSLLWWIKKGIIYEREFQLIPDCTGTFIVFTLDALEVMLDCRKVSITARHHTVQYIL